MRAQGMATSRYLRPVSTAHDGAVTGNNSLRKNAHAAYEFGKTLRSWVWASRLAARRGLFPKRRSLHFRSALRWPEGESPRQRAVPLSRCARLVARKTESAA